MKNRQTQKVQAQTPSVPNDSNTKAELRVEKHSYYEGPLPHPQVLKEYKDVNINFPDVIIESFLDEGKHRRKMESKIVNFGFISQIAGIVAALVAIAPVFYVSIMFMEKGYATQAASILCTVVIGLAAVFLGRNINKKAKSDKE
jgi:uncharacterized membrane protein